MAPRTKASNGAVRTHAEDMMLTVGLDIGYGAVKAVTPNQALDPFPSVYGQAREIKFRPEEIATKYPGDQISDDVGDWFVGHLALSQLPQGEQLYLRGRSADEETIGNEFRVRMTKVAIGKLLPGHKGGETIHLRIATGLPVDHMGDAPALKASLIGQHLIKTDATEFVANIMDVMVMPQPYGTIYRKVLLDSGDYNPDHTAERTGVVDVGTYSVDLTLDDRGEYIDTDSGSAESGIWTAQNHIAAYYERTYRAKLNYRDMEEILRHRRLKIRGQVVWFDQEVEEALEPLRRATIQKMQHLWGGGERIDVIYLSGGGAYFVEDRIKDAYPQAVLVENAQYANARGYLNYALLAQRNEGR